MAGTVHDITERKRAEEKLRESEERFRSLIQNASDLITILEEDGTIRYESPAIERVLGYSPEERIGNNTFDYLHPDDEERTKVSFAEALDNPGEVRPPVEFRLRHKDGSWRHMESTRTNLLQDPAVKGVVANSRDVTDRKQAEEKIRESEERYRAVMEQSAEAIWLFDPDTKQVLESNTAFQEMLGYTAEELRGMTNYDFVAHSREDIDATVWRKAQEEKDPPEERMYRRADGTLLNVEVKGTLISYGGKEVVCSVARDLTERKEAEKALRESEERYRQLVDLSPEMVAVHGDGKWLYINDAGARLLGASNSEELIGKPVMDFVHPDFREIVRSRHSQLERGESNTFLEQKLIRLDGQVVDVEVASAPLSYQGKPANQSLVRDITERKKAEKALRESEERFRSAFEDSPIGVALVDLDGQRFRVNRALCEMLGYSEEELLCAYLEHVHPDDRETSSEHLRRLLEKGTGNYTLERRYLHADGRVVWNLTSVSLIQDSRGEPSHLVCLHQDITERKELEEQLRHQAFYDSLTGLPNRALFLDRLGHALARAGREDSPVAVLLIDLDDFKAINDSLGHNAGNAVLVEVAGRFQASVRPGDTVGRIFGDEFTILLETPAGEEEACRVTERIQKGLQAPFKVDGQEVFVRASIGVALGETDEDQPNEVLRHADLAMYEAKNAGNVRYEVYNPSMDTRLVERMNLERDLSRAVEREEFEVHYQPKVLLETEAIVGVEALVRWQHPERGLLPASQFIQLAEKTCLIDQIGPWVLKESCRQLKEWQERYPQKFGLPFGLCVNLSAREIRQPDLAEKVAGVLRETGLDPACLMLEITERTAKEEAEQTIGKLRELKELGVELAIDDFGTGYCSLLYLEHSLLDILKIDRLVVHRERKDPEEYTAILSAMTSMAHSLSLEVIVEGVETEEQATKLKEMGCEMAQGHYFAEPLPNEALEKLLVEGASL
jgi:diguanylate cyclase (GGDEF)-like protein/PAS domain S-box-containing protein